MATIRFEWDEAKNLANQQKHGVSFEQAMAAFRDLLCVTVPERIEDGGRQWQTLDVTKSVLLLMVAHTTTERFEDGTPVEVIRIITARPATRQERRRYEYENG